MRRHIHYEAAFEDYLRSRGLPYVAVDEARKAVFGGTSVKSFDFLVYQHSGPHWLVDVKGRKFPYDTPGNARKWENWITREDLQDLDEWQQAFGPGFRSVIVFAYWMTGPPRNWPFRQVHPFRQAHYAFLAVPLDEYRARCVPRSDRWQTVTIPTRAFRDLVRLF